MRFRHYNSLRVFTIAARHNSFSAAAEELHLTKGAISHQIRLLEDELGFALFRRLPRGVALTARGQGLLNATQAAFETVESKISELRTAGRRTLTIGCSTYFASRWLSPRLMDFITTHPHIRLRVQPMIDQLALASAGIDLAIRWGSGKWRDVAIELLFACPAWPSGNAQASDAVRRLGLQGAFDTFTLLRDRDDSNAWSDWFAVAGLSFRRKPDSLIIPDPNVRVQAVIDGQGVALNDALLESELRVGALDRLCDEELADYGYFLAYPAGAVSNPDIDAFIRWMKRQV
ncbi:MAG: LysR substrate-binding domain-containing protein [Paracoccaceae bacterium]|nr:LysR substrate-binding domain-containing protein [Paracoccaceae bacterium]